MDSFNRKELQNIRDRARYFFDLSINESWKDAFFEMMLVSDRLDAMFSRSDSQVTVHKDEPKSWVFDGNHQFYTDHDKDAPSVIKDRNGQVVLSLCKICGGAEGCLPTNCPGRPMTTVEQDLVYNRKLDF